MVLQRKGVGFRNRPSSALSTQNTDIQGYVPTTSRPVEQDTSRYSTQNEDVQGYVPPNLTPVTQVATGSVMHPGGSSGYRAESAAQSAATAYAEYAAQFAANQSGMERYQGIDPADQQAIDAEFALQESEAALQQAILDKDWKEAERLEIEVGANKAALDAATLHTKQMAYPEFDKAALFARDINERNAPKAAINTATGMIEQGTAFGQAEGTSAATVDLIGGGEAAKAAAMKIAGADQDLFLTNTYNRGQTASKIIGFQEDIGRAEVENIGAMFNRQMIEDEAGDKQHWADEDRAIADMFDSLNQRKEGMSIDAERRKQNKSNAERQAIPDQIDFEAQDAHGTGIEAGADYIETHLGNIPPHRVIAVESQFESLFEDPLFKDLTPQGVMDYYMTDQFVVRDGVEVNVGTRAAGVGLNLEEVKAIAAAMGVYGPAVANFSQQTSGPITRHGEADNTNSSSLEDARNYEGVYGARRQFTVDKAAEMADAYNLTYDSPGWMRPVNDGPGAQSDNSDHFTGGALDFYGSAADRAKAADDFRNRPYVSFVNEHIGDDPPHLHVSFYVGYFS